MPLKSQPGKGARWSSLGWMAFVPTFGQNIMATFVNPVSVSVVGVCECAGSVSFFPVFFLMFVSGCGWLVDYHYFLSAKLFFFSSSFV